MGAFQSFLWTSCCSAFLKTFVCQPVVCPNCPSLPQTTEEMQLPDWFQQTPQALCTGQIKTAFQVGSATPPLVRSGGGDWGVGLCTHPGRPGLLCHSGLLVSQDCWLLVHVAASKLGMGQGGGSGAGAQREGAGQNTTISSLRCLNAADFCRPSVNFRALKKLILTLFFS